MNYRATTRTGTLWTLSVALNAIGCVNASDHTDDECRAKLASALATLGRTPSAIAACTAEVKEGNSRDPAATLFEKLNLHGAAVNDSGRSSRVELELQRRDGQWQGRAACSKQKRPRALW